MQTEEDKKLQEAQEKAWNLMSKKGLTLSEMMIVRSAYASTYKHDYPNVETENIRGEVREMFKQDVVFKSTIKRISSFMFTNVQEVILANAIYENTKDNFNPNDFVQHLKYTFRLLGVESRWAE